MKMVNLPGGYRLYLSRVYRYYWKYAHWPRRSGGDKHCLNIRPVFAIIEICKRRNLGGV